MWIIPTNSELSVFVPAGGCSTWDLSELSQTYARSLLWKSKHSAPSIWRRRLNARKNWWLRSLSGRTLKPSMHGPFVTAYTASLAVIPASRSAQRADAKAPPTPGTFGRILNGISTQYDLFGASSRTSKGTSASATTQYTKAWKEWVTQLRREYTRRLNWGRHRYANACSSLRQPTLVDCGTAWPTPTAKEGKRTSNSFGRIVPNLDKSVKMWATPTVMDEIDCVRSYEKIKETQAKTDAGMVNLREQVFHPQLTHSRKPETPKMWPSPTGLESEKDWKNQGQNSLTKMNLNGQLAPASPNTPGKRPVLLNPAWVAQLMGTTSAETFFACTETG